MCRTSGLQHLWRRVLLTLCAMRGVVNAEDTMRLPLRRHSPSRPEASILACDLKSSRWISIVDKLKSKNWLSRTHSLKANMTSTQFHLHAPTTDAGGNDELELALSPMNLEVVSQKLIDVADVFYTVVVGIGTPPQYARMILDTGSSDMWVKPTTYKYDSSSTFALELAAEVGIQYGRGMLNGVQVVDRVCFGDWCAAKQSFLLAKSIVGIDNGAYFDGLVGLGGPGLFREPRGTPILNKLLGHDRPHTAFALYLAKSSLESLVYFGSVGALEAEARKLGLVQKYPIKVWKINGQSTYWLLKGLASTHDKIGAGLELLPQPIYSILDSGTTLLAVPEYEFSNLLTAIVGDDDKVKGRCGMSGGTPLCECSVEANPLKLTFPTLDGNSLDIELTKDDLFTFRGVNVFGDSICSVNVMNAGLMPFWILGDVVLRKVYAIHDLKESRVILFPRESSPTTFQQSQPMLSTPLAVLALFFASACVSISMIRGFHRCREKIHKSFDGQSDLRDGLL